MSPYKNDKNEEKPSTETYLTVTDLQNSGGDLQLVEKIGVPNQHLLNPELMILHDLLERIGVPSDPQDYAEVET